VLFWLLNKLCNEKGCWVLLRLLRLVEPVLGSISNTSIRNTYLKYIYVFCICIWNTFWCICILFQAKNTKYILMWKYDVIALISKHIFSCLPWFLPVLPICPCAGWVRLHNYRIDCIITALTVGTIIMMCQSPHQTTDVGWSTWELFE